MRLKTNLMTMAVTLIAVSMIVPTSRATEIEMVAVADAYVHEGVPDRNFGDSNLLRVGSICDPAPVGTGPQGRKRTLVRFELIEPLACTEIISVRLMFFQTDLALVPDGMDVHLCEQPWSEGAVTWNDQPSTGAYLGNMPSATTADVVLETEALRVAVENAMMSAVDQPEISFVIRLPQDHLCSGSGGLLGDTLASREDQYHPSPRLILETAPVGPDFRRDWPRCMAGPDEPIDYTCDCTDFDGDGDADLADFAEFQSAVGE